MSDLEARIDGDLVGPADGWRLEWIDRRHGLARLVGDRGAVPLLVEGTGTDWVVTLGGRRIVVSVRSWRERVLAEAESAARAHAGPVAVKATLPGLVVAVAVSAGDEVEEGSVLLTLEAMKMQNEVRAPRSGRVIDVAVAAGETVATGAALLRIE
jgi:acetyl/propionyl-CoA carboxylase alpha subunit